MTIADHEGLISRIRQLHRPAAARERPTLASPLPDRVQSLETRVAQLEHQIEGMQDSVHRESERHARMIIELQAQVQPSAMSAALAKDARARGI